MTKDVLELDRGDRFTLTRALSGWVARCETEAAQMEAWAQEWKAAPATRDKCIANAKASRGFAEDAKAHIGE